MEGEIPYLHIFCHYQLFSVCLWVTVIHMVQFQKNTWHVYFLLSYNWKYVGCECSGSLITSFNAVICLRYWSILPVLLLFISYLLSVGQARHCCTAAKHASLRNKLGCEIKRQETVWVFQICMANVNSPKISSVKVGGDLVGGLSSPCWEKQWLALEETKQNKTQQKVES